MDDRPALSPARSMFPRQMGDSRFAGELEKLLEQVEGDDRARHLLELGQDRTANVLVDFAAGRRHDNSYRLRHFYWSAQNFSEPGIFARTLAYHRKDDAARWTDFPQDGRLPTIAEVLARFPPTRVLRYIPLRRLTYAALSKDGMPIVVKIKQNERIAEATQRLQRIGCQRSQSGAAFLVPQVLGHDPGLACMIQSFVQGELLQTTFWKRDSSDIRRLGAALCDLHKFDISGLPSLTGEQLKATALETIDWLAFMMPDCSAALLRTAALLRRHVPIDAPAVLCHGDFNASQLIYSGGGWTILDFDRVHAGNPLIDIANFIAKLNREPPNGIEASQVASIQAEFIGSYERAAEMAVNSKSLAFHISCAEIHHLQQILKKGQYNSQAFTSGMDRIRDAAEISLA